MLKATAGEPVPNPEGVKVPLYLKTENTPAAHGSRLTAHGSRLTLYSK
jgi:hypothetical protein